MDARRERSNMPKTRTKAAKSALPSAQIEVGLACDTNTSLAGIHGLTDLFKYANDFTEKRQNPGDRAAIRITHWRADNANHDVRCTYDSCPGSPHTLNVLIIPGNEQATVEPVKAGAHRPRGVPGAMILARWMERVRDVHDVRLDEPRR